MPTPCVCTTVRKANRALFRFYENALAESELSVVQFAILRSLERNGATPLSRLAEDQVMERTSLYRTLAPLIDRGAVTLAAAERGRAKIARLTPAGERLSKEVLPCWDKAQRTAGKKIGADQWRSLSAVLLSIPDLLAET